MRDYEAESRAVHEKTARLKALRLAKEAAGQKPVAKKKASRQSKTTPPCAPERRNQSVVSGLAQSQTSPSSLSPDLSETPKERAGLAPRSIKLRDVLSGFQYLATKGAAPKR
jgi:hypothetical protein